MHSILRQVASILGSVVGLTLPLAVAQAASVKVVYSFGSTQSGSYPVSRLLKLASGFYGTAYSGGGGAGCGGGCGTVFDVTSSGQERTLYAFQGGADGAGPSSGLVELNGILYGTTSYAGTAGPYGNGTVFAITPGGTYTQLHAFAGADGAYPSGGLIAMDGVLYGMTSEGGANGLGTVFSITPQGQLSTIYSFAGVDGSYPKDGLTAVEGTLYGVTQYGGAGYRNNNHSGNGVLFSLVPGNAETVLHSFAGHVDGAYPNGDLLSLGGELFGTTATGTGTVGGTVFKFTLDGGYRRLHTFTRDDANPSYPNGGLVNFHGVVYGTSENGGSGDDGTVFSVSKSGDVSVVYSFLPHKGAAFGPAAGFITAHGALYSTTQVGGTNTQCTNSEGCGTVFTVAP